MHMNLLTIELIHICTIIVIIIMNNRTRENRVLSPDTCKYFVYKTTSVYVRFSQMIVIVYVREPAWIQGIRLIQ